MQNQTATFTKDNAKTIINVVDMEDKFIVMVTITSDTGKTTRKTAGARKSMSRQAKSRKETGKMESSRHEHVEISRN